MVVRKRRHDKLCMWRTLVRSFGKNLVKLLPMVTWETFSCCAVSAPFFTPPPLLCGVQAPSASLSSGGWPVAAFGHTWTAQVHCLPTSRSLIWAHPCGLLFQRGNTSRFQVLEPDVFGCHYPASCQSDPLFSTDKVLTLLLYICSNHF